MYFHTALRLYHTVLRIANTERAKMPVPLNLYRTISIMPGVPTTISPPSAVS